MIKPCRVPLAHAGRMAPLASPTDPLSGLSPEEAARRLREHGPNALDTEAPRTWVQRLLALGREPMFMLLVTAALLFHPHPQT